jgi:hypothetical protein
MFCRRQQARRGALPTFLFPKSDFTPYSDGVCGVFLPENSVIWDVLVQ